jgi:2-polyprenyl-6-methoxyphenol hydroxylase-like FAD-dependent oxidoreductase
MGDFLDNTPLGADAHLFFTAAGAVESFPMPEGRRRWIVQTEQRLTEAVSDYISRTVRERTGINLHPADQLNQSSFSPWRLDCAQLHRGRVLLCGDAAHVMSPIGGQGMNTGIADAEFAAAMLQAILQGSQPAEPWLQAYARCRGIAARTAAKRAARGMGLGTWRGVASSLLRDLIMRFCLSRGPMATYVGRWFAMISIPYNSLEKSEWAMRQLDLIKTPDQGCS